jgi:hypothetical protein
MRDERPEEQLRRALVESVGDDEVGDLDLLRIQRALDEELSRAELDALLERAIAEPGLARAWALARELRAGLGPPERAEPARASRWVWSSAAAAAALAAVLVVAVRTPPPPVERAARPPGILSTIPDGAALARTGFTLGWEAAGEGARYRLEILDEELRLVDQATDLETTSHTVPAAALAELAPGTVLYWRVEALLPDGEVVSSPTFVQTLE